MWNTGSINSSITVSLPGTYYVDVVDACGQLSSDTIVLSAAPPIPFSIGPDRIKCNADTLHLNATGGFLNYTWGPNYNISSLITQNVIVQPAIDTIYFVKAEKTPGCFAFDTVRVTVKNSPVINLGADISFCNGDSSILDAGSGFNQYVWSNGSISAQTIVHNAGAYSVIGIAANGCKSYDTLNVSNVWPSPIVSLTNDTELCIGQTRTYNAGVFNPDFEHAKENELEKKLYKDSTCILLHMGMLIHESFTLILYTNNIKDLWNCSYKNRNQALSLLYHVLGKKVGKSESKWSAKTDQPASNPL